MTPIGGTRRPSYRAAKDARASSPNLFQSNCYSIECSASDARAAFSSWLTARRCSTISTEYIPCSQLPLRLPLAPPRAPWNRHTLQPRTAGALQGLRVRFEVAVHRGAERKRLTGFMRCPRLFSSSPLLGVRLPPVTTAWPPPCTCTCWCCTVISCLPLERWRLRASICAAKVRLHLFKIVASASAHRTR